MRTILIVAALIVGVTIGCLSSKAYIRNLRKRVRELMAGKDPASAIRSVTRFLFVTTQICALGWVSVSYGIAIYSTVALKQPFPVVELSQQAIDALLGVSTLKVLGNIFEHNDGPVFGHTKESEDTQ